jgi:hypothetical protein
MFMARYLWLTWSAIVFHISLNFLLQERTNINSGGPVDLEVFPFKIWLAHRLDIYMFGALILPFCSATALLVLALHLRGSHAASHLDRLPALIDSEKLGSHARVTETDRWLDRCMRVAWPLLFLAVSAVASWHFVTGFINEPVYTHYPPWKFFDSGWASHLGHLNLFQTDLRYAACDGATYIAGLFPYFAVINLIAYTGLASWWLFVWLPSPLWATRRSAKP